MPTARWKGSFRYNVAMLQPLQLERPTVSPEPRRPRISLQPPNESSSKCSDVRTAEACLPPSSTASSTTMIQTRQASVAEAPAVKRPSLPGHLFPSRPRPQAVTTFSDAFRTANRAAVGGTSVASSPMANGTRPVPPSGACPTRSTARARAGLRGRGWRTQSQT